MTTQDIEAELSYAYLHAVAAKAGVDCQATNRALDNAGTDAILHVTQDFGPGAVLTDISVHVQLKATVKPPTSRDGKLGYFFEGIDQYNRLRADTVVPSHLLVVLFLPSDAEAWLRHTARQLVLKRCAYWVSLRGAPESANETGQTVYLPRDQAFSPDGLNSLLGRIARQEELRYEV